MTAFGPDLPQFSEMAPGIRRLLAPNPSVMTGPGTNTYLIGTGEVAVIDPGPNLDEHIERIVDAAGAPIGWVLVTHTHPDHSPAARALAGLAGAELLGIPAPDSGRQDRSFEPDRILADGDTLVTNEFELEAVHTPGHASNHLCYRHTETNWLLTGDQVIDGSTVVIDPPDGDMKDYIDSLRRIKVMGCEALLPGHGDRIDDPVRLVNWIIDHRLERETKVIAALRGSPGASPRDLVPQVYRDVAEHLFALAERSLLAHLLKLQVEDLVEESGGRWSLR